MSHQRIINIHHSTELYKLAIVADFENFTYNVVITRSNHSHSSLDYHILATYPNIQEATRDFNHRVATDDPETYKALYDAARIGYGV